MSQGFTSGVPISTDVNLSPDSDFLVPSQHAVKTYVDTEIAAIADETLAQTLVAGNTTGGTGIVVSAGDDITITDATASRVAIIGASKEVDSSTTTTTQLSYLDATSSIQTQLNSKKTIATGNNYRFATTGATGDLQETAVTASRAVVTDVNGLPTASATTATQIGYCDFTSSGQTQLNSKGYTLTAAGIAFNPADSITYYIGSGYSFAPGTVIDDRRLYVPTTGTITKVYGFIRSTTGGSNQTSNVYIRNESTSTEQTITSTLDVSPTSSPLYTAFSNNGLSLAVTEGNWITVKWTTPVWGTNPLGCTITVIIWIV